MPVDDVANEDRDGALLAHSWSRKTKKCHSLSREICLVQLFVCLIYRVLCRLLGGAAKMTVAWTDPGVVELEE